MALKMAEKTIDGVNYTISQISATRSVKLLARLGRVLGPALGQIAGLVEGIDPEKSVADQEIDLNAAGDVVRALFATLDDAEIDGLLRELFSNVVAFGDAKDLGFVGAFDGNLRNIDAHFSGRVDSLFRVAFASLEVNYGSFFGALAALAPRRKGKAAAPVAPSAGSST